MRRAIICLIVLLFTGRAAFSQLEEEPKLSVGGYASFMLDCRMLEKHCAFFTGGEGGVIVGGFRVGVFYSGLRTNFSRSDTSTFRHTLAITHGGLSVGYTFPAHKDLHALVDMKFSYGRIRHIDTNQKIDDVCGFFGFTPNIAAEYLIHENIAIALGINYMMPFIPKNLEHYDSQTHFFMPGIFFNIKIGAFK